MNHDEMETFEQRLRRQPVKPLPADWRAEILRAAKPSPSRPEANWLSTLNQKLSTLLWPHPKAWAGLAAVWVFIFILNAASRDTSSAPVMAEKASPPSPEVVAELKKQQQLFAELIGSAEPLDADRRKHLPPGPRSERVQEMMV
jgi:hypothetical protein